MSASKKVEYEHQTAERKVVFEMNSQKNELPIAIPDLRLKRILLPVDFSESSSKALHYAVKLAQLFHAEIFVLHVIVFVPPPPQMLALETEELNLKYREAATRHLAEWHKKIDPEIKSKSLIRNGTAADHEIVEAARETQSDLIVIGNHGRTGLARMLIGSTAEHVVRLAPCPVLVIREHEHDFISETEPAFQTQNQKGKTNYGNHPEEK